VIFLAFDFNTMQVTDDDPYAGVTVGEGWTPFDQSPQADYNKPIPEEYDISNLTDASYPDSSENDSAPFSEEIPLKDFSGSSSSRSVSVSGSGSSTSHDSDSSVSSSSVSSFTVSSSSETAAFVTVSSSDSYLSGLNVSTSESISTDTSYKQKGLFERFSLPYFILFAVLVFIFAYRRKKKGVRR
jgi:hypothetical protein